jgi:hypothetical protein
MRPNRIITWYYKDRKPGKGQIIMAIKRSLLAIFIIIVLGSVSNADEIHLKDGKIIKAESCWTENNKVYYQKYGSTVSLPEEKVLKIVYSSDSSENSASAYSNGNDSKDGFKTKSNKKTRPIDICYNECENTKIICVVEKNKDKKDCLLDEKLCQIPCVFDTQPSFKMPYDSWESKVLDLNQIDLTKFTKKAKAGRIKRIEEAKLRAAKSCRNMWSCSYMGYLHSYIVADNELKFIEKAFFEELGVNLEAEAEKSFGTD